MRVIIVGGGLAVLTPINVLETANVEFVLLEARTRLDSQIGALINFNSAALRLLNRRI